jgi:hypothetical protein
MNDVAGNIGKTKIASAIAVSQFGVIHAKHVEGSCVEVVYVDRLVYGFETEVVGSAVGGAAFDASASQDRGEAPAIVIATVLKFDESTDFDDGCSAKLATNDNESFT